LSAVWLTLAVGVLAGAGGLLYFQILRPYLRMRESLRQLASRNFPGMPLPSATGLFKGPAGDIRRISDHLRSLDRQMADEGFSLQAILSSMVEGVFIADRSRKIRLVNNALLTLLGLKVSPLNRPVIEVIRRHELQNALESTLATGTPQEIQIVMEVPAASGGYELKHLNIHISSLAPHQQIHPNAVLVVLHDVTVLRKLEARQRELLSNVSHEFRTPLAIINGYVETLADGASSDPAMLEQALGVMHKNARRLTLLIDDLLTLSSLEERTKLLRFQPVDLRQILAGTLDHLASDISAHGTHILLDWPEDATPAEADARRMEQVFSNLIENALRYGAGKNPTLRISAERLENKIHITFSDNGPGIPLGDQAHIFERFYRVHKDRSRHAGGTGLGLSIVKTIVEAHGGQITVQSSPGAGATFFVTLPINQETVFSSGQ